jgi:PAS domain S-box-containing protein
LFGIIFYETETDRAEKEKYQELSTIGQLKVNEITAWRRDCGNDINVFSKSPIFKKYLKEWIENSRREVPPDIKERMNLVAKEYDYRAVLIVSLDSKVLVSLSNHTERVDIETERAIESCLKSGSPVIGEPFISSDGGSILLDVVMSFQDNEAKPFALAVFRIDASKYLFPLIELWPTPSKTGETLLVKREGDEVVFLNSLRHLPNSALKVKRPVSDIYLPASRVVMGKKGVFQGIDYRGVPVLADLTQIPNSSWYLVAKIDKDEILRPVYVRGSAIIIFSTLLIILIAAGFAFFYRSKQLSLYQNLYLLEQQQRETQGEFKTILYSIGDAVITTDTRLTVKHLNYEAERLTGWSEAESSGKSLDEILNIINENTRNRADNPVREAISTGKSTSMEAHTTIISKYGHETPIDDSASPITNERGEIIGAVMVFRDQTQERVTLNELSASEEKFRLMFESSPMGVFHFDTSGVITACNNKFIEIIGSSREDLIEMNMLQTLRDDKMLEAIQESLQGRIGRYEDCYRSVTAEKTTPVKCEFAPITIEGKITGGIGIVEDVTERKMGEEIVHLRIRLFEYASNHTLEELLQKTLDEIGRLTNSPIGFYHFISDDEDSILLQSWSTKTINEFCKASGKGEHYPLNMAGIWADSVRQKRPIIHNDYKTSPNKRGLPEGHAEVIRELVVPIIRSDKVVGVLGIGNRPTPYTEDDIAVVSFVADVAWEVASKKKIEEALKLSEQKYRELVENANSIILRMDSNGDLLFMNEFGQAFFGFSEEDLIGKNVIGNIVPEIESTGRDLKLLLKQICEKPTEFEKNINENMRKDGRLAWIEWTNKALYNEDGTVKEVFCIGSDITSRKKAEEQLSESEEQFRKIFDNSPAWIAIVHINTSRILEVNESWSALTGYSREEAIGKTAVELGLYSEELYNQVVEDARQHKSAKGIETVMTIKGNQKRTLLISREVISIKSEPYLLAMGLDITDRKIAEKERENLIFELQDALTKVKTLSGLIPICSSCKKIRDDSGYWQQLETFVKERSEAEFTHGLCPECEKDLYQELGR